MPNLSDAIIKIVKNYESNAEPTNIITGTVSSVEPLKIKIYENMPPIPETALVLTSAVVERKIAVLGHAHDITVDGVTYTTDERLDNIVCIENGVALPVEDGYIILNRKLAVGDIVTMLSVQAGQKYIVLSRLFD